MVINRISIYDEFSCLMDKCPINCCRGWNVPVDDETIKKYNNEEGYVKVRFIRATKEKDGITIFKNHFFGCPYWGKDKLCSIQKTKGIGYMPRVCVFFPRSRYNAGFFCEETMFMSCPAVTRLFLSHAKNKDHFNYRSFEGTPDYEISTTNDDKDFIGYLIKTREQIIDSLDIKIRFDSLALLKYAYDAQNACTNNEQLPDFENYMEGEYGNFVLENESFDKILKTGFYHPKLLPRLPILFKLCIVYKKEFSVLNGKDPEKAEKKLNAMKDKLYEKIPDFDIILSRYYEYYLRSEFINIFEDYSFAKHIFYGMVKAHMMTIFLSLYAYANKTITDDGIADVVASFERRSQTLDSPHFNRFLSEVLKKYAISVKFYSENG